MCLAEFFPLGEKKEGKEKTVRIIDGRRGPSHSTARNIFPPHPHPHRDRDKKGEGKDRSDDVDDEPRSRGIRGNCGNNPNP